MTLESQQRSRSSTARRKALYHLYGFSRQLCNSVSMLRFISFVWLYSKNGWCFRTTGWAKCGKKTYNYETGMRIWFSLLVLLALLTFTAIQTFFSVCRQDWKLSDNITIQAFYCTICILRETSIFISALKCTFYV